MANVPKIYQGAGYEYVFGVPDTITVAGMALESIKIDRQPEFEAEGKDQEGSTIAYVVGDNKFTFTASGYLHDTDAFAAIDDFAMTIDGVSLTLIINAKNVTQSNTDFQKIEITGVGFTVIGDATGVEL